MKEDISTGEEMQSARWHDEEFLCETGTEERLAEVGEASKNQRRFHLSSLPLTKHRNGQELRHDQQHPFCGRVQERQHCAVGEEAGGGGRDEGEQQCGCVIEVATPSRHP